VRHKGTRGGEEVMPTEAANGDFHGSHLLAIVGRLPAVDRNIFLNIWMKVPDSRNREKPEGPLHASASVYFG
jgi:hypothetical protein